MHIASYMLRRIEVPHALLNMAKAGKFITKRE